MPYPHLATLLGAVAFGGVAVLRRLGRPVPVRVVAGFVAAVVGAALGALVDAAGPMLLASANLLPAGLAAANRQLAETDWRRVVGDALTDPMWQSVIVGGVIVAAVSVALSFGGLAFIVRSVFRRTAIWAGAGIALIASAAVLVVTKVPFAREEGGWMLILGAMVAAGLVNGRLFNPGGGIYWQVPTTDLAFERAVLMRPPPLVAWIVRQLLTRVFRVPAGEAQRAVASTDQGLGRAIPAELTAEAPPPPARPGERVIWERGAARNTPPRIAERLRDAADVDAMLASLRAQREGPMPQGLRWQGGLVATMVAAAAALLRLGLRVVRRG